MGELGYDIHVLCDSGLSAGRREMEPRDMITRHLLDTSTPSAEYGLTELGSELLPAIDAIVKVGMKLKHEPHVRRRVAG